MAVHGTGRRSGTARSADTSGAARGATSTRVPGIVDVLVSTVVPGIPTMRRRRLHGTLFFVFGVVAPIGWLVISVLAHRSWIELGLDRAFLRQLIVVICIAVIIRLAAVGEVLASAPDGSGARLRAGVAFAALLSVTIPSAVGVAAAADARDDIGRAFADGPSEPLFDAAEPVTTDPVDTAPPSIAPTVPVTVPGATLPEHTIPHEIVPVPTEPPPPPAGPPDSGIDPALLSDVSTILLLGGDAGPGRSGLRTDSMILVSIHRPSGRAALVSVPRNLERIRFAPGSALAARYPNGFDDIANAVYPRVSSNEQLRNAYRVDGLRPGAVAIAQTIGYSLDVTIDDYVLVDMQGFLEVIDALGGVTVNVRKAVPSPGNPPGAKHEVPEIIEAGVQHMDGTLALAYVRSRKADSDYQRMRRQRDVLAALASQVTVGSALTGYTAVTAAVGDSLHTSLTTEEFTTFLGVLGAETAIFESVGLAPPLVKVERPNYDQMAKIVGAVQLALVTGEHSGY
jgi:polyisoprenyl-teichoic acid--peptidoglycan teichoic acid transferase